MLFQLNNDNTKLILKESTSEEYKQLKLFLNPFVKDYRFTTRFKYTSWDGRYDYFHNGNINFGLWKEVLDCCKEYDFKFDVINKESFPKDNNIILNDIQNFCDDFFKNHKQKDNITQFKPYEHQVDAAYKMLKYKFGLIEVATSGGKSLIFSIMAFFILKKIKPDAKILLIVPSLQLVTQFYDDILDYNYGFNKENVDPLNLKIQEVMSDKPRKVRDNEIPNIYIGTYQSLINYGTPELIPNFYNQFDLVCCDESHKAKASEIQSIMKRTIGHATYRVGMSGTYPPKGSAELFAIEEVTGPILIVVKAKELMEKNIISNVKIKSLLLNYNDIQFARDVFTIKRLGQGKKAYELEKEYAQNSEKRKLFLTNLVNKFKHNSIMLFHNINYGKELYDFFRSNVSDKDFYYIDGETPSEKRQYIKTQMEITSDRPKILVSSFGTTSTGLSINALKNLVLCDSFKSDSLIRQSIGRILRLHKIKDIAIVYDIVDIFHTSYRTTLFKHFIVRRDLIYKKQEYPYDEIKINL
jgi:superfamily II DNA or RNA helicase